MKEISLAIDTPDGIVLIVGCSHPTIEKIVEAAKNTINKPIHLVLGGTHLLPAKDDQISSIAVSLRDKWGVRYLAPVHCTGEPAFAILKETFGDHYVYAGLGTTVLLGPKVTVKAEAGQPNKVAMDEEDLRSYRDAMVRGPLRRCSGEVLLAPQAHPFQDQQGDFVRRKRKKSDETYVAFRPVRHHRPAPGRCTRCSGIGT